MSALNSSNPELGEAHFGPGSEEKWRTIAGEDIGPKPGR